MNKLAIIVSIAAIAISLFALQQKGLLGGATSGLYSIAATSSRITIGTSSPTTLFESTSNCTNRIITTKSQRIKLLFDNLFSTSTLLTDSVATGHDQAASTTEHYDSETFGCGVVSAIGFGGSNDFPGSTSSSTLTISEFR